MFFFLFRRLRTWLLLAIALPLARLVIHRLALTAAGATRPAARHGCSARPTRP